MLSGYKSHLYCNLRTNEKERKHFCSVLEDSDQKSGRFRLSKVGLIAGYSF